MTNDKSAVVQGNCIKLFTSGKGKGGGSRINEEQEKKFRLQKDEKINLGPRQMSNRIFASCD